MTSEELLKIARSIPVKTEGRNSWARFRPAAFVLREKGYPWPEIARILTENGDSITNVESFCACMSKAYNDHLRELTASRSKIEDETFSPRDSIAVTLPIH